MEGAAARNSNRACADDWTRSRLQVFKSPQEFELDSFLMRRGGRGMLYTVLLGSLCVVILQLQLQPANGSPQMFNDDLVRLQDQVPLSADALIHRLKVFVKVRSYQMYILYIQV